MICLSQSFLCINKYGIVIPIVQNNSSVTWTMKVSEDMYAWMKKKCLLDLPMVYTSLSGQYYRELLTSHLKPDLSNEWLANCFEFVELCVHPSVRQKGIESLLHDSLLKDIPFDTTILTTQYSNLAARNLYVRKGWIVIDDSFFPNEKTKERYLILGKKLS